MYPYGMQYFQFFCRSFKFKLESPRFTTNVHFIHTSSHGTFTDPRHLVIGLRAFFFFYHKNMTVLFRRYLRTMTCWLLSSSEGHLAGVA